MNNEPPYAYAVLSFWEQQPDRPVCMPRTGSRSGRRKSRGKAGDFSLRKQRKFGTSNEHEIPLPGIGEDREATPSLLQTVGSPPASHCLEPWWQGIS